MAIVRLEGLDQLKNPMNSPGIEPATVRLVAQCFNQLRYRVFPIIMILKIKIIFLNYFSIQNMLRQSVQTISNYLNVNL
jgi:hypothetical protein